MKYLVCSGGGMKGCFQSGSINRLATIGKEYDGFFGTSVGSINAVGLAQYKFLRDGANYIERLWRGVKTSDVKKNWPFFFLQGYFEGGLCNSKPLHDFLQKHIDLHRLKTSGKKLGVCATNLRTRKTEIFTEQSKHIVDAVLASSITPMFLAPVQIGGEGDFYLDGGVKEVVPLKSAIDAGATEIDVIMTDPLEQKEEDFKINMLNVGMAVIGMMAHEIANNDVAKAIAENPSVKITVVRPEKQLDGDVLDFSPELIEKHIAYGYEMAKKVVG